MPHSAAKERWSEQRQVDEKAPLSAVETASSRVGGTAAAMELKKGSRSEWGLAAEKAHRRALRRAASWGSAAAGEKAWR
jgi:hypothetical protein